MHVNEEASGGRRVQSIKGGKENDILSVKIDSVMNEFHRHDRQRLKIRGGWRIEISPKAPAANT